MAQLTEQHSKQLLQRIGLPIASAILARTADEAFAAGTTIAGPCVVKAQVPAGGRGKAGGVLVVHTPQQARDAFTAVTNLDIDGYRAATALVEPLFASTAEFYLAVVLDVNLTLPVALFSASGGVDVERRGPITSIPLQTGSSFPAQSFRRAGYAAGLDAPLVERLLSIAKILARAFEIYDARLVETNPVAVAADGTLTALDARIIADDAALFRQPELASFIADAPMRVEDAIRAETRLEYVRIGGDVGIISGGAGMTMAVMDLVAATGAQPACFLDCSANPTRDGYERALHLLLQDDNVRSILISIFGGLTQVDRVAKTLRDLLHDPKPSKPITIRLMGTNVDRADELLAEAGLTNYRSLEEAISVAVARSVSAPDRQIA